MRDPSGPALPHERRETGVEPLLFVLLSAAWGSSYLFIKIGVETLPVFSLVTWRLTFGTALLVLAVAALRVALPRDPRISGRLAVISVVNSVIRSRSSRGPSDRSTPGSHRSSTPRRRSSRCSSAWSRSTRSA
jgi:hypothetical protein